MFTFGDALCGARAQRSGSSTHLSIDGSGDVSAGLLRGVGPCLSPLRPRAGAKEARRRYLPAIRLAPPAATALLWRRRLAHEQHRNSPIELGVRVRWRS